MMKIYVIDSEERYVMGETSTWIVVAENKEQAIRKVKENYFFEEETNDLRVGGEYDIITPGVVHEC